MSDWKEVRLGDVCEKIGSGSTPSGGSQAYKISGISFIRSQNVLDFLFDEQGLAFIDENQAKKLNGVTVKHGDVLLNITGDSVARACIVPNYILPARVNQHVSIIRTDNSRVINNFVLYHIQNVKQSLLALGSNGGTRNALTKSMIEQILIKLPDVKEQKAIADTLTSIEDMIELNNRTAKVLEELSQALYKNWFVKFDFPNEEGKPYKSSGGEMVESEIGLIPKGWTVLQFKEFLTIRSEKSSEIDVPEYSVTNLGVFPRDKKFKKQLSASKSKNKIIKKNDLVFGMSREILNWGLMKEEIAGVSSAYNVFSIDCNKVEPLYLEKYMNANIGYFMDIIKPASREGQGIDKNILLGKYIFTPDKSILKLFQEVSLTIDEQLEEINQETQTLINLRDTLLPKLMSGEIRVPYEKEN